MRYPYTSDSLLDQLIKSPDHYIVTTDLEGNITFCNEAFQKRYQIVGESVLGVGFDAFIDIEDMVRFKRAIAECVRKQLPSVKISYKVLSGLDSSESIDYDLTLVNDKQNHPIGVLQIGRDASAVSANNGAPEVVMEVKEAPQVYTKTATAVATSSNGTDFTKIADYLPEMIWTSDTSHEVNYVNNAWLEFGGVELEDEIGEGWFQSIHPEDVQRVIIERKDAFQRHLGYSITYRVRRHDGSYRWITNKGNPVYNANGEFTGYVGTCLDITAVKEAQIQIRRQQELMENAKVEFGKFTRIAQKISSIVLLCNKDNCITWVNDAFVKITGFTLKEVAGKNPNSFLQGAETSQETLQKINKVIEQGRGIRTEILYYTKGGVKLWLDIMIDSILDKDGNTSGYISIQKDITLKKVSEKEVQEQMTHLKKISFITSHELRHEFSKILQLIQTSKYQDNNVETYRQVLSELEKSANLMNDAIYKLNDQVSFASTSSISLNKYLLNNAIEEICLVDDDPLVNKLNALIIKNVIPSLPVHIFEGIDESLKYIRENPNVKRKIFLDLNFGGKSGWEFLQEYEKMGQRWPVIILTSSIDHADYERSKKFSNVTHFITKPLTIEQFEKLSQLEEA
ncbi:MAG: PAS domain S-box protein [Sphingobacteriia bacterium]|nr:PAS domain S-box protein [Sphingobacteriia bacterium]